MLVDFLRANADVFAWSPSDMPGIPRDVAEHSLDIRAGARPVRQPLRRFDEEKRRAIGEEIHKLMAAGFIKEVFHPEWLANPVLVRKKGGKWRMCVDYTGLNKACPKVPYPLPRIDQIVDSTAGCETLSFLDAYSGYHQIRMKESDQLATSFITPFGMYCYVTMPFGLRNAGATYQRCMNHVFGEHIGRTVEAYVDDIVVKTRKASDLLSDLEVTFRCLKAKGVKLNPEKCVFGVPRGMLLGFIVSERGIEANPEKIAATTQRPEPLSEMLSGKASTGQRRWLTPLELSAPAKGANSMRSGRTRPLRLCRQYPSPGPSLYGVWTSSVPCRRRPGATRTCWSPSTNSPSGSRSDL